MTSTMRVWLVVIAVLSLAGAVRVAVVVRFQPLLSEDRDGYRVLGQRLEEGRGFSDADGRPTAYRPPLYPLLIAGIIACGGGPKTLGAVQVLLGVATVGMTWALARRLLDARRAAIAAALVAVDPLLAQYTAHVMTETLFTALSTGLLLVLASPESGRPSRQVLAGALFGLAALCRPTIWMYGAALAGWNGILALRNSGARGVWKEVRTHLPLAASVALTVLPWVLRNAIVLGHPILTTTHGGYTLLLANNPVVYREEVDKPWGATWDEAPPGRRQSDWLTATLDDLQRDLGPNPGEVAADRWMTRRAWRNIREEPATFLRSIVFRVRRLWNVAPLGAAATGVPRAIVLAVTIFYVILFGAAIAGFARVVWLLRRTSSEAATKARPAWAPSFLLLLSFTAVHGVYWSNARMRAPLMPVVAILAAAALPARLPPSSGNTRDDENNAE